MWLSVHEGTLPWPCGPASEADEGLVQVVPEPRRHRGSLKPYSIKNKLTDTSFLICIVSESPANKQPGGSGAQRRHEEDKKYYRSKDSRSHLPEAFFRQDRSAS